MLIPCSRVPGGGGGAWNPAGPSHPGLHALGRTRGDVCPPGGRARGRGNPRQPVGSRYHPGNPVVPPGGTHSQPGRVRRPAATPSVPALGSGTAGGGRAGRLSPAGAELARLCRREARACRSKDTGRPWKSRWKGTSRPGGSPARQPIWSSTSPRPPWPGWYLRCSAWPGPEDKALAQAVNLPRPMCPSWSCRWGINLRGKGPGRVDGAVVSRSNHDFLYRPAEGYIV